MAGQKKRGRKDFNIKIVGRARFSNGAVDSSPGTRAIDFKKFFGPTVLL